MDDEFHFNKRFDGSLSETRRVLLNRDRLLALDEGLPVLVIEGPSGYGKTVLAEMWLDRQRGSANCCWVSLDATSADPVLLLDQLLMAVGADYAAGQEAGIDDQAGCTERYSYLCSHLAQARTEFRIVIDDVQVLADSASRPWLENLLGLASNRLRICLTLQPLKLEVGLGRLAANGQVTWIPARHLALTRDEVAEFARLRGQDLSVSQLDWLYGATEGWPALTQLALATPLDAAPTNGASVNGSGPLREYIYERFLRGLSPDELDVLWTLSCLGSAPVALLMSLDPRPARTELALLHFRALGIVQNRDPDEGGVFGLHALIGEGASRLLDRERPHRRMDLIRKAADWYWRSGFGADAVRLALENGVALAAVARDWLVELGFTFIFRSGQHQTFLDLVHRWEQVSGQTDAKIDQIAAWALIFQRQFPMAEVRLDRIDAAGPDAAPSATALQRAVLVSLRDDYARGGVLAGRWIEQNRGRHTFDMGVASTVYAFSQQCIGNFDESHVALREAMYCFNVAQSAYGIGWAHCVGAVVLVRAGRYRGALAQVESGLARCPSSQGFCSLRALLRALEAFLRYERNELDRARDALGEALPLLADQAVVDAVSLGYKAAARTRAAASDFGTALDILSEGELIGIERHLPSLSLTLRAERALLLARSGSLNQARDTVQSIHADGPLCTAVALLRARLAIADGDGPLARDLLQSIVPRARKQGRQNRLCEILLQLASAEELCGDEVAAFAALTEALDIGSAEGYLRTFLDEGASLRALIARWVERSAGHSRPGLALAHQFIALGEGSADREAPRSASATFNKRERQILSLLNDGLSNAQLAKRCFISEGTVKWYLHNLYEKLGVGNRTALLRAVREQGLKL